MSPLKQPKIGTDIRRIGFTLVEAVLSLVVIAAMLVAALTTVGAARLSQQKTSDASRAQRLAEDLMAEILIRPYADPDQSPTFGPEASESTTTRNDFDDADDYNGWSASPPQTKDGSAIPNLTGWSRSVTVEWVEPMDVSQVKAFETNTKRITVTAKHGSIPRAVLVAVRGNHDF